MERCDVAVNIFAKPYQTALTLLSLWQASHEHIKTFWLQFEPAGSRYDTESPYAIAYYLRDELKLPCVVFQPDHWFDCAVADRSRFGDVSYRMGLRFAYAFERAKSRLLFLIHNDVVFQKDYLGLLLQKIGTACAAGPLGQCWNCPAAVESLTRSVLGRPACRPENYQTFRLSFDELRQLYAAADAAKRCKRSYSDGLSTLASPWPLPECRVNEWACLINLAKTRPLTEPAGDALPIGAYEACGSHTLDIGVSWFRSMHAHGLTALHVPSTDYLIHWVGTGNKSKVRYTQAEENAKRLLSRLFPRYLTFLASCKI